MSPQRGGATPSRSRCTHRSASYSTRPSCPRVLRAVHDPCLQVASPVRCRGRAPSSRCRRAPPLATAVRDDHAGTVPAPLATLRPALPGIVVALAVGIVATVVGTLVPVVGGPVPAVVLGVLVGWLVRRRTEGELGNVAPGVKFASSRVLQAAVVLLGAQLSIGAVLRIGAETLRISADPRPILS